MNNYEMKYRIFLEKLKERVESEKFINGLKIARDMDLCNWPKNITIEEIKKIIEEYKENSKLIKNNNIKNIQVILEGNPSIFLRILLEAIRQNFNALIIINNYCLKQNKIIINLIKNILQEQEIKIELELKNLVSKNQIIEKSFKLEKTICIGNSDLYNSIFGKAKNVILNPYNIIEIYSDSEEYEEIEKKLYEFAEINMYEIEFYKDLDYVEAIKAINRDGYGFATLLLSKDEEKIKKFKKEIKSKYIFINENPFMNTKFDLVV